MSKYIVFPAKNVELRMIYAQRALELGYRWGDVGYEDNCKKFWQSICLSVEKNAIYNYMNSYPNIVNNYEWGNVNDFLFTDKYKVKKEPIVVTLNKYRALVTDVVTVDGMELTRAKLLEVQNAIKDYAAKKDKFKFTDDIKYVIFPIHNTSEAYKTLLKNRMVELGYHFNGHYYDSLTLSFSENIANSGKFTDFTAPPHSHIFGDVNKLLFTDEYRFDKRSPIDIPWNNSYTISVSYIIKVGCTILQVDVVDRLLKAMDDYAK